MSDKPEGPGWWIASDGNWYPPELHPSVREGSRMQSPVDTPVQPAGQAAPMAAQAAHPSRWQHSGGDEGHVGPQFPDLFQKALQGSHLADNVTVMNGVDEDGLSNSFTSTRTGGGQRTGTPVTAATGGSGGSGGSGKRRWRKGH